MQILIRKRMLGIAALGLSGSIWAVNGGIAQTPVKFSIDWVFQGAHAPFAVAIQKNYYKREGLDVTMDRGTGFNHDHPDTAVTAVLMVYNSTPAGIVTLTKTGVREPSDLAGRRIASPIGDAARLLFPAFAQKIGIDSDSIEWTSSLPNLRDTLLFQGKVDAVASYVPTTIMALEALGATKDEIIVFNYSRYLPGLLGSGLLVRPAMLNERPAVVRAFIKGTIAGLQDSLMDPEAAVRMLTPYDRLINIPGEVNRLKLILSYSMQGDLLRQQGLGHVSQAQLREGVDLMAAVSGIAPPGDLATIYNQSLLPPPEERRF
jgi:NitT/TauT family transport system substrate-binding protein